MSEADYLIHESNVGIHTGLDKLESLPSDLRSRLGLIHYPDDLEQSDTTLHLLREGETIEVVGAEAARRSA